MLTFPVEHLARICSLLECKTQVGEPHQPPCMLYVIRVAYMKGCPTRIGNPTMFFREALRQDLIMNGLREWDIQCAAVMQVPDFCPSKTKLRTSIAVRMFGYTGPGENLTHEICQRILLR